MKTPPDKRMTRKKTGYEGFSAVGRIVAQHVGWFNGWTASEEEFKKSCEAAGEKIRQREVSRAIREAAKVLNHCDCIGNSCSVHYKQILALSTKAGAGRGRKS